MELSGHVITLRVWTARAGHIRLYLLDSDHAREAVLAALRARRVYATNGPRILLRAGLGEHRMGSIIPAPVSGKLTEDLFERCRTRFEQALKDAKLKASDIDEVILVGGATRVPAVQRAVEELPGVSSCRVDLGRDRILLVDGEPMPDWSDWVEYVRERPETTIDLVIERDGQQYATPVVEIKNLNSFKAVEMGIADPDRICIYGGSYGGYAAMAGLTFTPELYQCGINYVGVTDINLLFDTMPAAWKPLRKEMKRTIGDFDDPQERADMARRSPINHVDKIKVPLLMGYGKEDPRVVLDHALKLEEKLKVHEVDYELIIKEDEGHGFRAPDNRMAMAVAMEAFLAKHLGGRYQEDVPAELAVQLGSCGVLDPDIRPGDVVVPSAALGLDGGQGGQAGVARGQVGDEEAGGVDGRCEAQLDNRRLDRLA